MGDFTIKLGSITNRENSFSFEIKDSFFEAFAFSEIQNADISAVAKTKKDSEKISLNLSITGQINNVPCDICAENISVNISGQTNMIIKKSDEELTSNDEILYVSKNRNQINLKHIIFELIIVNAPKKRKHPLDSKGNSTCNKEMLNLLNKYTNIKGRPFDPRWNALKNLK